MTLFETGQSSGGANTTKKINLQIEPSLIAIGPYYLCATLNNKSIFYSLEENNAEPIVHEYSLGLSILLFLRSLFLQLLLKYQKFQRNI